MVIVEMATGQELTVAISPAEGKDFRHITKKRYFFDWKKERGNADMFKLTVAGQSDILGLALKRYSGLACVSLLPKTELRAHYKQEYGMMDGGPQLYLDGVGLQALVNKYLS